MTKQVNGRHNRRVIGQGPDPHCGGVIPNVNTVFVPSDGLGGVKSISLNDVPVPADSAGNVNLVIETELDSKIEVIKQNGVELPIINKTVNINTPKKTSDLQNDSGFVTAADVVTSVNGQKGDVVINKGSIGLGNVDNTSDLDKPVSNATATELAKKADKADTYTKAEVDVKLKAVYRVRPSVDTFDDLPMTGNEVGDVRNVKDTGQNYVWIEEDGTAYWDSLSATINPGSFMTVDTENNLAYEWAMIGDNKAKVTMNGPTLLQIEGKTDFAYDPSHSVQLDVNLIRLRDGLLETDVSITAQRIATVAKVGPGLNSVIELTPRGFNMSDLVEGRTYKVVFPKSAPGNPERVAPLSVNGVFADDNGNIAIQAGGGDDPNAVKKNQSNQLTADFEMKDAYGNTLKFGQMLGSTPYPEFDYQSQNGNQVLTFGPLRLSAQYGGMASYGLNPDSVGMYNGSGNFGVINRPVDGRGIIRIPDTDGDTKNIAVSINGKLADAKGNIEIPEGGEIFYYPDERDIPFQKGEVMSYEDASGSRHLYKSLIDDNMTLPTDPRNPFKWTHKVNSVVAEWDATVDYVPGDMVILQVANPPNGDEMAMICLLPNKNDHPANYSGTWDSNNPIVPYMGVWNPFGYYQAGQNVLYNNNVYKIDRQIGPPAEYYPEPLTWLKLTDVDTEVAIEAENGVTYDGKVRLRAYADVPDDNAATPDWAKYDVDFWGYAQDTDDGDGAFAKLGLGRIGNHELGALLGSSVYKVIDPSRITPSTSFTAHYPIGRADVSTGRQRTDDTIPLIQFVVNHGNQDTPSTATITGTGFPFKGYEYASDYSPNYSPRSLPDVGFVTAKIAQAIAGIPTETPNLTQVLAKGNIGENGMQLTGYASDHLTKDGLSFGYMALPGDGTTSYIAHKNGDKTSLISLGNGTAFIKVRSGSNPNVSFGQDISTFYTPVAGGEAIEDDQFITKGQYKSMRVIDSTTTAYDYDSFVAQYGLSADNVGKIVICYNIGIEFECINTSDDGVIWITRPIGVLKQGDIS